MGRETKLRRTVYCRARSPALSIRGVIVLTVKLFGETLETPRTLTVWH
ncbi:hypothetical protein [Streptomyces buecherae]